jgi:hypothetical protein
MFTLYGNLHVDIKCVCTWMINLCVALNQTWCIEGVCCFSSKVNLGLGFDSHTCISFNNCCVSCAHYECYFFVHVFSFLCIFQFLCILLLSLQVWNFYQDVYLMLKILWIFQFFLVEVWIFFSWFCINISCSSFCGCLKVWNFCHSVMYVVKFSIHVAISVHDQICICKF